jgi:hypothetical protein
VNRLWLILVVALLGGCAAPLPKYPAMEPAAALATMRARDSALRSMQSECDLTLTDASGSSVSFDAAIVADWPDKLRLRAWKFGHAAFDLTYTPEGLWMYIPEEARRRAGDKANFSVTADQFGRVWRMLGPGALGGAEVAAQTERMLTVRKAMSGTSNDQGVLECDIDRETLTVRAYRFVDPEGKLRQTLLMSSYRVYGEPEKPLVWPVRITAEGEGGKISVRVMDPEFNGELPPAAFTAPGRAVKQP